MSAFLDIIREYGPYIALPIVVAGLIEAMKGSFGKFFLHTRIGIRILHFIPVVLGALGGLLLPEDTLQEKLLLGGALGAVSHVIYKLVTKTLASKEKLDEKIQQRESALPVPPEEDTEDTEDTEGTEDTDAGDDPVEEK
jgi:hypothetical protein